MPPTVMFNALVQYFNLSFIMKNKNYNVQIHGFFLFLLLFICKNIMATKKITLNELRNIVKQIIKEEKSFDEWKDINEMVNRFLKVENPDIEKLKSLDEMDFVALIYSLYSGQYELTGISNKGFLRYFMTSGRNEDTNIPLKILNNLPYTKNDFIKQIEKQ